jgi:hypothetical protein
MKLPIHIALLASFVLGFSAIDATTPAEAKTHCHYVGAKHSRHHHVVCSNKKNHKSRHGAVVSPVREAQSHLANLGYYHGRVDGKLGSKTKSAIKAFQREHGLRANGVLTKQTMGKLVAADRMMAMSGLPMPHDKLSHNLAEPDFYAAHPDYYGHVDPNYADPVQLARSNAAPLSQGLPTRFAQITMTEVPSGNLKRYDVTINGQSILTVDNQPSVVGVSKTFVLGDEDGILITSFNPNDSVCSFKHTLLVLRDGGNELRPVENCTRGYQATVKENSLFIVFPESDDARAVGATWRYEKGSLERL